MAASPSQIQNATRVRLISFEPGHATHVAQWAADPHDAFLVAPHTPPPITAQRVLEWAVAARHALVLLRDEQPRAYGELNHLNALTRRWWLGHLLVAPEFRGRGLGQELVRQLVRKAFQEHAARCVTLVVYPQNERAIQSYLAAGMRLDGFEIHHFAAYNQQVQMLRMAIYARQMKPTPM